MENVINLFNGFVDIENENVSCKIVNEYMSFDELVESVVDKYCVCVSERVRESV